MHSAYPGRHGCVSRLASLGMKWVLKSAVTICIPPPPLAGIQSCCEYPGNVSAQCNFCNGCEKIITGGT